MSGGSKCFVVCLFVHYSLYRKQHDLCFPSLFFFLLSSLKIMYVLHLCNSEAKRRLIDSFVVSNNKYNCMNEQCILLIWLCISRVFTVFHNVSVSVLGLRAGRVSAPQNHPRGSFETATTIASWVSLSRSTTNNKLPTVYFIINK